MVTFKHILLLLSTILAISLTSIGCTQGHDDPINSPTDDPQTGTTKPTPLKITAVISNETSASGRVAYAQRDNNLHVSWINGDNIFGYYIHDNVKHKITLSASVGQETTFSLTHGDLDKATNGDTFYMYYAPNYDENNIQADGSISVALGQQDGTLENLRQHTILAAKATAANNKVAFTFQKQVCVLHLSGIAISGLSTIAISGSGITNQCTLAPTDGNNWQVSLGNKQPIIIKPNGDALQDAYIMMFPSKTTLEASLQTGTDMYLVARTEKELACGAKYQVEVGTQSSHSTADLFINTEADLRSFAQNIGNYSGKSIRLGTDIVLNQDWNFNTTTFNGSFYGNNHSITFNGSSNHALFGTLGNSAQMVGTTINGTINQPYNDGSATYLGAFVANTAQLTNKIKRCRNNAHICYTHNSTQPLYVGGISGNFKGDLEGCENTGTIDVTIDNSSSNNPAVCVGGLVGIIELTTAHYITCCANRGAVQVTRNGSGGTSSVGGIFGYTITSGNVVGCYNAGNISAPEDNTKVGSFAGWINHTTFHIDGGYTTTNEAFGKNDSENATVTTITDEYLKTNEFVTDINNVIKDNNKKYVYLFSHQENDYPTIINKSELSQP